MKLHGWYLMIKEDWPRIRWGIGAQVEWHYHGINRFTADLYFDLIVLYDVAVDVGQANRTQPVLVSLHRGQPLTLNDP